MDGNVFLELCKDEVARLFNMHNSINNRKITKDEIFVVWSCKTLQNNKALVSTNINDGIYYEVTFNGDKKELYIDTYRKYGNDKIVL